MSTTMTCEHLRTVDLGEGLIDICLDRSEGPVNTLDAALLADLERVLTALRAEPALRGVLLSSAKDAFLAGADMQALWTLLHQDTEAQRSFCIGMHRVFSQFEALPVPVVCAIQGYALGGGLEAALCADYRVLASDARIGFPEVGFGILPAAGGTVRTPRLAGAATALEWLAGGRQYPADAALRAGMVDAISEPAALRDTALSVLRRAASGEIDWSGRREQRRGGFAVDVDALATARNAADQRGTHYPAAAVIVDLLERCAPLERDAAILEEIDAFADLARTPTSRALVGIFMASQQLKRDSRAQAGHARSIRRAAVLGAGIMGGGVACASVLRGTPVLLKDVATAPLELGLSEARKLLARQVEGGRLDAAGAEAVLASITPTLDYSGFEEVDIVVEAVVENLAVKRNVLREVEAASDTDTVFASNTSSLSIAEIAAAAQRPQNVVGMHFFNPVHRMPLVEIVRGPQSSDAAVATTVAFALAMGKVPLVVSDCAGFLVNRLLGAYFTAFLQLVRDGADIVQIDRVLEAWGWPMGPAYLLDVAGLDTLDKALAILAQAYPEVMATDFETAIQKLTGQRHYGQKTGMGFYRYEPDARGRPRRSHDPAIRGLLAEVRTGGPREFSDSEILDRMMLAMLLEADRCLEQQVVRGPQELDAGMRLGTGFPAHYVGPLWFADQLGADEVLRRCAGYSALGGLYRPGPGLQERAGRHRPYYAEH